MHPMMRAAILDARLDAPKLPWPELLAIVLRDGEKFWWRRENIVDVDSVVAVFVELHRVPQDLVRAETKRLTVAWPAADKRQMRW